MEIRTDVPVTPARRFAEGWVVVDTLERRSGPGENYSSYPVPFRRGDRVVIMDCVMDHEGNQWALVGPEVWAAMSWQGKVYISGEPCK